MERACGPALDGVGCRWAGRSSPSDTGPSEPLVWPLPTMGCAAPSAVSCYRRRCLRRGNLHRCPRRRTCPAFTVVQVLQISVRAGCPRLRSRSTRVSVGCDTKSRALCYRANDPSIATCETPSPRRGDSATFCATSPEEVAEVSVIPLPTAHRPVALVVAVSGSGGPSPGDGPARRTPWPSPSTKVSALATSPDYAFRGRLCRSSAYAGWTQSGLRLTGPAVQGAAN